MARRLRAPFRLALRAAQWAAAGLVVTLVLFRLVGPPTTLYIESERWRLGGIERARVDIGDLPPLVRLAFVGAEDARFCGHWGIDFTAVRDAMEDNAEGRRLRGGSTITQQVAKNVFLWHGRSWLRKGLEAGFALAVDLVWPKRRILEVYLNVAEMGEGIFGLESAARAHFGRSAAKLTPMQAALIAAALPDPKGRSPARPSAFLNRRAASILSSAETLLADGAGACVLDTA